MYEETYIYLILILLFISFFRFLHIRHNEPEIEGCLKQIEPEYLSKDINWDISGKTKIWTPVFNKSPNFRDLIKWKHTLYDRQAIDLSFNFPHMKDKWMLYLCSDDLKVIKEYNNVSNITFSPHKRGNFELVNEGEAFILLLKSDSTEFSYSTVKYQHGDSVLAHKYQPDRIMCIDETGTEEELKNLSRALIDEMKNEDYELINIRDAEIKRKFPSNDIILEINTPALKGDVLFLLTTNKEKYGLENHKIEINNEMQDIIWKPEDKNLISSVKLENPEINTNFKFIERLRITEDSNILPFRVLTFARKKNIMGTFPEQEKIETEDSNSEDYDSEDYESEDYEFEDLD